MKIINKILKDFNFFVKFTIQVLPRVFMGDNKLNIISITEKLHNFFVNNKYVLVSVILGIFLMGFIAFQKVPYFKKDSASDYLKIEKAFQNWSANPTNPELFQKIADLMKKNPLLSSKYDGIIAQRLLWENAKMAGPLSKEVLGRIDNDGLFAKFAKGSLLIANGQFEEALEEAKNLKSDITNKDSLLYPYNLLRISVLEKQVGNKERELLAWQELEEYISDKKEKAKEFLEAFRVDKSNLAEYIEFRKKALVN